MVDKVNNFWISFIEEGILNPKYEGYVGGRVEVYGSETETGYAGRASNRQTKGLRLQKSQNQESIRDISAFLKRALYCPGL